MSREDTLFHNLKLDAERLEQEIKALKATNEELLKSLEILKKGKDESNK